MKHLIIIGSSLFFGTSQCMEMGPIEQIDVRSVYVPGGRNLSLYHTDDNNFTVKDNETGEFRPIERHMIHKDIRGVSKDKLNAFLGPGYLRIKSYDDGEFGLTGKVRGDGGGPVFAAYVYSGTKTLCYGIGAAAMAATIQLAAEGAVYIVGAGLAGAGQAVRTHAPGLQPIDGSGYVTTAQSNTQTLSDLQAPRSNYVINPQTGQPVDMWTGKPMPGTAPGNYVQNAQGQMVNRYDGAPMPTSVNSTTIIAGGSTTTAQNATRADFLSKLSIRSSTPVPQSTTGTALVPKAPGTSVVAVGQPYSPQPNPTAANVVRLTPAPIGGAVISTAILANASEEQKQLMSLAATGALASTSYGAGIIVIASGAVELLAIKLAAIALASPLP